MARIPPEARIHAADASSIRQAALALKAGRLVVFPTETVYGLGAHALNEVAVARIFKAKGRPADNPLIVHVASVDAAKALASRWPAWAEALAREFWPGPLTIVVPAADVVPAITRGGLATVALRMPSHRVALDLLESSGLPLAAPSANRSGRPSPTRAADAFEDLGEEVELYLDAGPTGVGVESSVVGEVDGRLTLLRAGGVAAAEIERIVGPLARPAPGGPALAPGMKYRHYAPKARMVLCPRASLQAASKKWIQTGAKVVVLAADETPIEGVDVHRMGPAADAAAWAHRLFSLLRQLDRAGVDVILVEEISEEGLGEAVMDRLRKAASGHADTSGGRGI
jgi:L-threonylcarbamoyladenylate synthase